MPRDGSGNYTLPAGNPVVTGTTVASAWANTTMADIAVQMNNVLTRDGLLGPLQPMKFPDGAIATPAMTYNSEPGLGWYRIGSSVMALASNNANALVMDSSNGSSGFMRFAPRLTTGSPQSSFVLQNQPYGTANRTDFTANMGATGASLSVTGVGSGTVLPLAFSAQRFTLTTNAVNDGVAIIDTGVGGANLKFTGNGATTPNKTIRVLSGQMEWINSAYSASIMTLTDAGVLTANNVGIFSDIRIKENIRPATIGAFQRLHHLGNYHYYNTKTMQEEQGLIAQEVEQFYPHLVTEDSEGIKSVNYIGLISEIIQAFREIPLPAVLPE